MGKCKYAINMRLFYPKRYSIYPKWVYFWW